MLIQLSYVSTAKPGLQLEDFKNILASATEHNQRLGITGILVYCNNSFLQILEGPREEVHEKFNEICSDCRHENLIKLQETPIKKRDFNDWQMAFKSYNKELSQLDDLSNTEFYDRVQCDSQEDSYVSRKVLCDFFDLNGMLGEPI